MSEEQHAAMRQSGLTKQFKCREGQVGGRGCWAAQHSPQHSHPVQDRVSRLEFSSGQSRTGGKDWRPGDPYSWNKGWKLSWNECYMLGIQK